MLERVRRKGNSLHCWWECKLVQLLWRTVWRFLKKLELELPYNPAIPLLGVQTKETRIERDTCTPIFIAALFTIAGTWKQPGCPSADEWIRKLWYIYTMEYYSAIKKNTFESVLMRWMKLEPITQSEVSQKEKHQYSILSRKFLTWLFFFSLDFISHSNRYIYDGIWRRQWFQNNHISAYYMFMSMRNSASPVTLTIY